MPDAQTRRSTAFSLLEVLMVIVIISVLTALVIPSVHPNTAAQLQAVASILGRDIEIARNLAVDNNDNYKLTFDLVNNQWTLTHSGMNTALDALPLSAFHLAGEPANQQIVALNRLPNLGGAVRLFAVWSLANPPQVVGDVEFLPVGSTTRTPPTLIWLVAGTGSATRYTSVRVHPVTGLFWVENFQSTMPTPGSFTSL